MFDRGLWSSRACRLATCSVQAFAFGIGLRHRLLRLPRFCRKILSFQIEQERGVRVSPYAVVGLI